MLFICSVCKYGHPSTDVEQFMKPNNKKIIYFCKKHINCPETNKLVHVPWISDTMDKSQFYCSRDSLNEIYKVD